VIVGFGGINPAGRSSLHHGYRRLVIDKLDEETASHTYRSLARLMGISTININDDQRRYIKNHTLVRKLENNLFDADQIFLQKPAKVHSANRKPLIFSMARKHLPHDVPPTWQVTDVDDDMSVNGRVLIQTDESLDILFPDHRSSRVHAGGQLPTGFDPEKLYQSRHHPRGLQLTVYGASDAIQSMGIDWDTVRQKVPGDQIAVYASSAMGQLDTYGAGGMLKSELMGKRVSSKNCALSLSEMPADFLNAYVLGSIGATAGNIGACATLLYNLRQGLNDIRSGKYRVAVVGASEAPLTSEVMEGYRTMGALAEDKELLKIEGKDSGEPDYRKACRPFSENCGFTLAEGSQFFILFDDALALELGATIYGSVADVFVNADGFKKSIPGPGIGNYITVGKAMGLIRSIIGDRSLANNTCMLAHGTGTPQNRVTESHIINEMASQFGIKKWPVAAIKSYLGHTLGPASGDQLACTLGIWEHGIVPGISSIDHIAEDVHSSHCDYLIDHLEVGKDSLDAILINSKGFGGNNATAGILSPAFTTRMLEKRHGKDALTKHAHLNETVREKTVQYDRDAIAGKTAPIYHFGENVVDGLDLTLSSSEITVPGYAEPINIDLPNPYDDMV
jgi:acetoacetyl-[acyl-carrier protein] synthase